MVRFLKFFMFFLLCLAVALVVNLPVQQVLAQVEMPRAVQLYGVDGRLFHGKVDEIVINRFPLRDIEYRFLPSCLGVLKVCYRIDYEKGRIELGYDILNGDTEISRSQVEYPVSEIVAHARNQLPVKLLGSLQIAIDESSLVKDKLNNVRGRLVWRKLGMRDNDQDINLGDYQVDFSGDGAGYELDFSDLDAGFDVTGKGKVSADGSYDVDVRLTAQGSVEPQVQSLLDLVAKRSSVNKYRIEQQGQLSPRITRQLFR